MRIARIVGGLNASEETVARYLPSNYRIIGNDPRLGILIGGDDVAGWTLDGYVIPRLGSGLIVAEEVEVPPCFEPIESEVNE